MGKAFLDASRGPAAMWYRTVRYEAKGGEVGGQNISITAVHTITGITLLGLLRVRA